MEQKTKTRKRVVSIPGEIAQPKRWADRHAHKRNVNAEPRTRSRLVKRTLAQTGVPASEGQVRLIRPLPRQPYAANIPVRSGRRSARSGGFWRRIMTLIALFVIGMVGVSFALSSSNFQIHRIDIMGTQNNKLVDEIQRMGIQGQNIFLLDAGDLTARIEALPMVDSVNLSKQLPNLVVINVVERTPVLLWQTQQGTFSVDRKGVVIAAASDTTGIDHLMTVEDVSKEVGKQIHPGTLFDAANIAFATQAYSRLEHLSGVSSFTLRYDVIPSQGGHGSFIVVSSNGWLAYLGGADDNNPLDNRLIELQQILNMAQQKQLNLATIDLRFGLRPVYRLKS
ncbi:MAG TPA: FtsQ-type POTRA domain-containing protein [Ktedonobacteraceae bacterium]|nr:FtsQ-type POTRA domain-containing protein [Ktedonobacteraceae bacterium]